MADFYTTPGGTGSGVFGWADATDIDGLKGIIEGPLTVPGDNFFTHGGSYTLPAGGIDTARSGSNLLPINLIGVKPGTTAEPPTPADRATGTDRPLFDDAGAGLPLRFNDFWQVQNIRLINAAVSGLRVDAGGLIRNVQVVAASTNAIFVGGQGTRVIDTEVTNTAGTGINIASAGITVIGAYVHDCLNHGIFVNGNYACIEKTIMAVCVTGLDCRAANFGRVTDSLIYSCPLGIDGTDAGDPDRWLFLSNIIANCTDPAIWANNVLSNFWDFNNWWANTNEPTNVTKGPNALALDPQFTNPGAGDFRIGSNLFGRGFGSGLGFGSPSVPNTGPWQGTPRRVAVPVPDLSADHFLLDGLEGVSLGDLAIESAYRRDLETQEASPSNAAYIQGDVQWDLPTVTEPGGAASPAPLVGDTITDDLTGTSYTVLGVREPWSGDYYGCHTRELRIVTDVDLRDLVSWYPVSVALDEFGSRVVTHPAAHADFTDVPARVQTQPAATIDADGVRQFERIFWIYSSVDIPVKIGDLFRDQEMNWYEILSWDPRETIDSFPKYVVRFKD